MAITLRFPVSLVSQDWRFVGLQHDIQFYQLTGEIGKWLDDRQHHGMVVINPHAGEKRATLHFVSHELAMLFKLTWL